jgi:ubiquinone/menaquinone biosynthesis C-methylase UbiE
MPKFFESQARSMQADSEKEYYEADLFWGNGALEDDFSLKRIQSTIAMVPSDVRTLLDAGCGNGVFGRLLLATRQEIRVTGLDRSSSALRFVDFEKFEGNVDALPFPDKSFDCVTCLQVIEHLPVHSYHATLRELARVSRKHILISVPYEERIEENSTRCPSCRTVFNADLHLRSFDMAELRSLMSPYGAEFLECVFPNQRRRKLYLEELLKRRQRRLDCRIFRSPVCPLCGYEETEIASACAGDAPQDRRSILSAITKRVAKSILEPLWPTETVLGYWAVCRYALVNK